MDVTPAHREDPAPWEAASGASAVNAKLRACFYRLTWQPALLRDSLTGLINWFSQRSRNHFRGSAVLKRSFGERLGPDWLSEAAGRSSKRVLLVHLSAADLLQTFTTRELEQELFRRFSWKFLQWEIDAQQPGTTYLFCCVAS